MELKLQNNVPLAASATFTSDWVDNGNFQSVFVRVTAYADQPGTLLIQQVDDAAQSNLVSNAGRTLISGNQALELRAAITARRWRVVLTNGPTAQTTLQLAVTASRDLQPAILEELKRLNFQLLALRGRRDAAQDEFLSVR